MLCQISQKDITRRVNRAFGTLRIAYIQIAAQLRRRTRERENIAVTLIVNAMRQFRHALGNEVRQLAEEIDIRRHHRMRKFMRQRPIEISRAGRTARAVDFIRQIIVILHVDLHRKFCRLAAFGIICVTHKREEILLLGDEFDIHFFDGRRTLRVKSEIVAVRCRDQVEPFLRPPSVEPVNDLLLNVRQFRRNRKFESVDGE